MPHPLSELLNHNKKISKIEPVDTITFAPKAQNNFNNY